MNLNENYTKSQSIDYQQVDKRTSLLRKGEKIYKEQFKGKEMEEAAWIDIMIAHPKLIERPIVVKDGKAVLGRPPENVLDLM